MHKISREEFCPPSACLSVDNYSKSLNDWLTTFEIFYLVYFYFTLNVIIIIYKLKVVTVINAYDIELRNSFSYDNINARLSIPLAQNSYFNIIW